MKKVMFLSLILAFATVQFSHAQMTADAAMKTYTKTKQSFNDLEASYKPYKDMAIQNSDKLSPELKTSMSNLDTEMSSLRNKLDGFPKASSTEQISMASSLKSDYSKVKDDTKAVTKSIKALKLPAMPKM